LRGGICERSIIGSSTTSSRSFFIPSAVALEDIDDFSRPVVLDLESSGFILLCYQMLILLNSQTFSSSNQNQICFISPKPMLENPNFPIGISRTPLSPPSSARDSSKRPLWLSITAFTSVNPKPEPGRCCTAKPR
jgi:hypothetical protein